MIPRAIFTTALGVSLLVVGAAAMSGCGGDGQPARGSISAPRKDRGAQKEISGKAKPKTARNGKFGG
jgi:hypothetical protein